MGMSIEDLKLFSVGGRYVPLFDGRPSGGSGVEAYFNGSRGPPRENVLLRRSVSSYSIKQNGTIGYVGVELLSV